ncbi:MAG: TonB-dependent receptor [Calditrichaeota bacterium]|nr:TonB-dependent receptor [Calditrichota bacterium]
MSLRRLLLLGCVMGLIGTQGWADLKEETPADSVRYRFNPVVVTATKVREAQRDLAASITLIDGARLALAPSVAVFDLVQTHVPSLFVTQWGVMGYGVAGSAAGKIAMRGLGGTADTHVLILRNGRPDFMGLMGCTIGDEFVTDGIDRVEVVRGPASFLYGTNATAGVINIVTQGLERPGFATSFAGGVGSFAMRHLSARHAGRLNKFNYQLTAARRSTDGHRQDGNAAYEGNFFTAHFGYDVAPRTAIEANATLADLYLYDPGPVSKPARDDWYDIRRWGGDLTVNHSSWLGESYLKLHANYGRHRFFDGWRSFDRMMGLMVYHNVRLLRGNTTTVGFDLKRYGGDAQNSVSGTDYGRYYLSEWAPYVHTQQLLFGRLIASAGVRLEHHELYGWEVLPKVGLVAHTTRSTSLRAAIAKGFRSPSIRELYFFPPHNPDLLPDEIWNYELGVDQHLGSRLRVEATLYRLRGDNLIVIAKNATPPPLFKLSNSGRVANTGYELVWQWEPVDRLELGGSWSHIVDMEVTVPNAPRKKVTAYASWRIGRFLLVADATGVRDWYGRDNASPKPNLYRMDDYLVVNLSAKVNLFGPLAVRMNARNLLDAQYQAMWGYPMPGRTLDGGFVVTF